MKRLSHGKKYMKMISHGKKYGAAVSIKDSTSRTMSSDRRGFFRGGQLLFGAIAAPMICMCFICPSVYLSRLNMMMV